MDSSSSFYSSSKSLLLPQHTEGPRQCYLPRTSVALQRASHLDVVGSIVNHDFISGSDITLSGLTASITEVYNLSFPLALLLAVSAFIIYGQFQSSTWTFTLELADVANLEKIAHLASAAHSTKPSSTPDSALLSNMMSFAKSQEYTHVVLSEAPSTLLQLPSSQPVLALTDGVSLSQTGECIQRRHVATRELEPLNQNTSRKPISLGESALAWLVSSSNAFDSELTDKGSFGSGASEWSV